MKSTSMERWLEILTRAGKQQGFLDRRGVAMVLENKLPYKFKLTTGKRKFIP